MIPLQSIKDYAKRISEEFHPQKIILFGSYASGTPTPDSDVDLLVVMDGGNCVMKPSLEIRRRIKPPFPLDLIVKSPIYMEKRLQMRDFFLRDIAQNGIVLYERRS